MFTNEYTSAVEGGEGGGDGEDGGSEQGEGVEVDTLKEVMEEEEGVSETKVMLFASFASS